jgi:integrase
MSEQNPELKTKYPGVCTRRQKNRSTKKLETVYTIRYIAPNGKRYHETVGSAKLLSASQVSNIRTQKINGDRLPNSVQREKEIQARLEQSGKSTFKKLWEFYLEGKGNYASRQTDSGIYNKHISPVFGDKTPSEIILLDIERFSRNLSNKKNLKPQTVKHVLALVARLAKYGQDRGICEGLSFSIKFPKLDNQKTEDLTPDQLSRLLQAIDEDTNIIIVNLMKMALLTGMRRSELFKLRWEDVDFTRRFILIREPKGGKSQKIPLNSSTEKLLLSYKGKSPYPESDFVFPGRSGNQRVDCKNVLRRIRDRAQLPKDFRPLHGLRHVYASMLASSGKVDLYTLQKLLTHKSPQMTQRYAHLRDEALKQASEVSGEIIDDIINNGKKVVKLAKSKS